MSTNVMAARAAKAEILRSTRRNQRVVGVGIAPRDGHYVVKVKVSEPDPTVPAAVGDVTVIMDVTGAVRARTVS